jgi:hypothetical protein
MQPLVFGELRIEVARTTSMVRLDWRGRSNHRHPEGTLAPFLREAAASASHAESVVEMHFEGLEFFNSSTIAVIIQYVKDLRDRRIKLVFVFDPRHKWQKIFFDALWIFEKDDGLFRIQPILALGQ